MAKVRCKNTYGDGRVEYVEYEVEEASEEPEEITLEDALTALQRLGVDINEQI